VSVNPSRVKNLDTMRIIKDCCSRLRFRYLSSACFMGGDIVKFILIISLATIFSVQQAAFVCSCAPPPPPLDALGQSDPVFAGEVIGVERNALGYDVVVTFRISEIWKGVRSRRIRVTTADNGAACGFAFRVGTEYLVYAHGEEELHTNICPVRARSTTQGNTWRNSVPVPRLEVSFRKSFDELFEWC